MHAPVELELVVETESVVTVADDDAAPAGPFETIYSAPLQPNPQSARDVLAFLLTPVEAFADPGDDDELEVVTELLDGAKAEALRRWYGLHTAATCN